jgi:hypothetical protein
MGFPMNEYVSFYGIVRPFENRFQAIIETLFPGRHPSHPANACSRNGRTGKFRPISPGSGR